jgi:hypothetical protein
MSTIPTRIRAGEVPQQPSTVIPPQRRVLVDQARQSWIRKLIDLSRRNNLLYYRSTRTGTLDLSNVASESLATFLRGEEVSLRKLLPSGTDDSLSNTVRTIARRALVNLEEKGLQTLFVALGQATWPATDGGRPAEAPILLVPASLESRGRSSQSFHLKRTGPVQVNLVLLHVLENQYGVKISSDDLTLKLAGDEEDAPFDPCLVYKEITERSSTVPGLEVKDFAVLGNFAFQKMAMVKDLQERANELAGHEIISAIAGDNDARKILSATQQGVEPQELDHVAPDNEFNVLDADSSQQCAIAAILAGQNAVVHGPPGTGKSQTITNLIAGLAATGKRVLFVAEKRAALDVVIRRLEEVSLSHLAIDLHGADLSPKRVMRQIARTLDIVRNSIPANCEEIHKQVVDRRTRLNGHVERMHKRREPTGKSVFEMQGALLRFHNGVAAGTRWRGAELKRIDPRTAQRVRDLLAEARGFVGLFLRKDPSPWTGGNLPNGKAVQQALDLVSRITAESHPRFLESLNAILQQTGLRRPSSINGARDLADLVADVQRTLSQYRSDLYQQNLSNLLEGLQAGKQGGLSAAWASCVNASFRKARKTALALRTQGKATAAELFTELTRAADQSKKWQSLGGSLPTPISDADQHIRALKAFLQDMSTLGTILPERQVAHASIDDIGDLILKLAADTVTPHEIPKLTDIEKALEDSGAGNLVAEIRKINPNPKNWPAMFEFAWFSSTLDAASQEDPEIRGFKGQTHSRYVDDFARLDEERLSIAADRVRRAHGLHAIEAMNAHSDQEHLIRQEANKTRKHLPLRKVFAQAADVLTNVCPCWMASPLSVSQLLDGSQQYFDFVVFDEASQVLPEDAAPAILRARKIVVAGDNKQLPPTTFFAAGEDDATEGEETAVEGFESLLDMMLPFVRSRYLDWHYRSRDEALINFSNHHIYQDRLVTFPGPGGPPAIDHVLVQQEPETDGQEQSASTEVQKVVELILDHAGNRPKQTLGVITMGIRHMDRIQAALDHALAGNGDLHEFFDPNQHERFFIKNLERVQGDERDAIIISIGYGKDRGGNLPMRFGPLLSEGGRRRLNVAITRARQRLTVVSSFSHTDIDSARIRPGSGVEMLRDYLQYAGSNGKRLGDASLTSEPLNGFEAEIFDALSAHGMKLVPQVGASHFRIDMVAEHPNRPGRFVLAIECDGASYHSSYTARDRDRLRQQQLENLGWRFHRIWSTDWFLRKEEEINRALDAFQAAVGFADRIDAGVIPHSSIGNDHANAIGNGRAPRPLKRKPRPTIQLKPSISQYNSRELVQLIDWAASDGQLRTDDEIISEMVAVLGFARRGARIETVLKNAIGLWRAGK